jgi:hypothetical protein
MGPALDVLEAELLAAGRGTDIVHKLRSTELATGGRPSSSRPAGVHRDVRGHRERRTP